MPEMAQLKTVLEATTHFVTIVGVPVALWQYYVAKHKEQVAREHAAFSASNQRYCDYLGLLLSHQAYDLFELAGPSRKAGLAPDDKAMKRMILLASMLAMVECAWMWYRVAPTLELEKQWDAWERYINLWRRQEDFPRTWNVLKVLYHDKFCAYMDSQLAKP